MKKFVKTIIIGSMIMAAAYPSHSKNTQGSKYESRYEAGLDPYGINEQPTSSHPSGTADNLVVGSGLGTGASTPEDKGTRGRTSVELQKATFAGGCFWCMQPPYDDLPGVISTTVGYSGGSVKNPTYDEVSMGKTGHAEAVQIIFDPTKLKYAQLVETFWKNIDPTAKNRQFSDSGSQYRTAIFYHNEEQKQAAEASKAKLDLSGKFDKSIATEIVPLTEFYPAEKYHQDFYKNNPLRYNSYKVGSGRASYLEETWGKSK